MKIEKWKGHAARGRPPSGQGNYDRLVTRTGYDPLEGGFRGAMSAEDRARWHEEAADGYRRQWDLVMGFDSGSRRIKERYRRSMRGHEREARAWREVAERERRELVRVGERPAGEGQLGTQAVQFNLVLPIAPEPAVVDLDAVDQRED